MHFFKVVLPWRRARKSRRPQFVIKYIFQSCTPEFIGAMHSLQKREQEEERARITVNAGVQAQVGGRSVRGSGGGDTPIPHGTALHRIVRTAHQLRCNSLYSTCCAAHHCAAHHHCALSCSTNRSGAAGISNAN